MQDLHSTSYLPRAEPSTRPGGVSRSRTEPLAPRAVRPGGAINPHARKACQPSGIQESAAPPTGIYRHLNHLRFLTRSFAGAQDDVGGRDSPIPIPTAPQALEPSSPKDPSRPQRHHKRAPSINLEAPSTTLSGIAAVKLKNPRGDSPVKL